MLRQPVKLLFMSLILFGTLILFQNCGTQFEISYPAVENLYSSPATDSSPSVVLNSEQLIFNSQAFTITFDISGKADSVQCTLIETAEKKDCDTKSISFNNLSDGDYTLEISVYKLGAVVNSKRLLIRKDTLSPTIQLATTPPQQTSLQTATFSFLVTDNLSGISHLECALDGAEYSKCATSVTYSNLALGSHNHRIRAIDRANNVSSATSYSWTVQSKDLPTLTLAPLGYSITNSNSATFNFTGTLVTSFQCSIDGGQFSLCVSPKVFSALGNGQHVFKVKGLSADGVSTSESQSLWIVDRVAPGAPTITANVKSFTNLTSALFNFSSSDTNGISKYECALDSDTFSECTSPKSVNVSVGAIHIFKVRSIDNAMNTSLTSSFSWTVDAVPPMLEYSATPLQSETSTVASFQFAASDSLSGLDTVQCSLDNAKFSNCTSPINLSGLSVSQHTFSVQAADKAGNLKSISYTWTVTNNSTPPTQPPVSAPFACAADALTCFDISTTSAQATFPITLGQPFKQGDLLSTQGLVAKDGLSGEVLPLQMDDVSSHVDGSVRFAVLSIQLKNLQAGVSKVINLYKDSNKKVSAANVPANPDWNLELEAKVYNGNTLVSTLVSKPQSKLVQQIANNSGVRFKGEVASEFNVMSEFVDIATNAPHPHLVARLHTRILESGNRIRTDMVIENNWTFKSNPSNITYELNVRRNGIVLHNQPKFTHYHHARWHKVLWTGTSMPNYRVRHYMPYFIKSRAVLNYDLNLKISDYFLNELSNGLNESNTAPMASAQLATYFPMTGARLELAPVPAWTAAYIISQDDRALKSMMSNANAAAGVPVHYRDENTGHPLDVEKHPDVTVRYDISVPSIPDGVGTTIWEPDRAHQGSFAYVPYLVTGDVFYLDETMFWASWNITMSDPGSRERNKGLIFYEQLRGQAWSLRSIGEAAFATPDSHYLKSYFKNVLSNNLAFYGDPKNYSPIGGLHLRDYPGALIPWQGDFMLLVYSWLAFNNQPKALDAVNLIGKYQIGRFVNEANGFCPSKALVYDVKSNETSGEFITTWSRMFARNFPSYVGISCDKVPFNEEAYPTDPSSMSAMARASMATAKTLAISDAATAYTKIKSMTPAIDGAYKDDPTWAIVSE